MNTRPHKLFFVLLLSVPTVVLSSAPSDQGSKEDTVMYPNTPTTEIQPLPDLNNQGRRTVSEADVQEWKTLLERQQHNIQRTTTVVKAMTDLLNAAEPAALPMSPTRKPLSPKNNRK